MTIEKVRQSSVEIKEQKKYLDRLEFQEALRHGNIYEVFAKTPIKLAEYEIFFRDRLLEYKSQVVQDMDIKAQTAMCPEPSVQQFPMHNPESKVSASDMESFGNSMLSKGFKGSKLAGVKASDSGDKMSEDEIDQAASDVLDEWAQFQSDTWEQIMDAQMMSDYKSRMNEIKEEVQRIVALAKSGNIGPEFVLIALAKVNQTKNGVLMSWLGQKAFHVNESLNKIANDLHSVSTSDPNYVGTAQMATARSRDGAYQLNLITGDLQKVMNDSASVLEQVKGMIDEINRTRREIVTKLAAH